MKGVRQAVRARNSIANLISSPQPLFLPFLYQTRTIQSGKRHLTVDPTQEQQPWIPRDNHIPFETNGQATPSSHPFRETTITNRERDAFKKLFDLVVKNPPSAGKKDEKISRMSEKSAHADAQQPEATELLEAAASELRSRRPQDDMVPIERFPVPLRRLAAEATRKVQEQQYVRLVEEQIKVEEEAERRPPDDPLVRLREEQHARVEELLRVASTDYAIWEVLEQHVFSVIRSLQLDELDKQSEDEETVYKPDPEQLAIIGPNYPSFLLMAIRQLRTNFPASFLTFQILPAVKQLGRSSYVLGASTPLYNEVIAATWQVWADCQKINDLLQEMDNSGLEFDENSLAILQRIQQEGSRAISGKQGDLKRMWWSFELVQNGWRSICEWIPVVEERLQALALRLANEREMQREQLEDEAAGES